MRVRGWETALNRHVEQARPFAWGQNDCALWCADWVRAATGQDFASQWRGRYASEAELAELLASRGLTGPAELPASVGLPEVHPVFAQRGDIVLNAQGCLGVCNGLNSHFLVERGVTVFRTRSCVRAWKVR